MSILRAARADSPGANGKLSARRARISRAELALVLVLVVLGCGLRTWKISSVGLNHFDEGVYVFSGLGLTQPDQPHRLYPQQIRFSPPMFFGLVGLAYSLFGTPSDWAPILINVVLGTLTVPVVWWVGRAWFGAAAGLAAAALLACSNFHIMLSRAALTDVAFALFFLLALGSIVATIERRSFFWAIVAGLAVGLAWNTKYHGWFALLIAGAAVFLYARQHDPRSVSPRRLMLLLLVMCAVATLCYLPWAAFIESQPGGYAALAQYQRTMLSRAYLQNLWRQADAQMFLEGPLSRASVPLGLLAALLVSRPGARFTTRFVVTVIALGASVLLVGGSGTVLLLALLSVPALLRNRGSFSSWLVLGWVALWLVALPLYRPYARLALPLMLALYLLAGVSLAAAASPSAAEETPARSRPLLAALMLVLVTVAATLAPAPSGLWRDSRSLARAATAMEREIPPESRVIVIGEPSLAFYLHLDNRPAFERTEDPALLEALADPAYVVTGIYSQTAPKLSTGLRNLTDRLVPLGTFAFTPNDLRLLDDFDPVRARSYRLHPDETFDLKLYRLLPRAQTS